jgi:hypothetical protein
MKKDMRDDFDKWTDQWEAAQKEGIFADAPKPAPQPIADFFGQYPTVDDKPLKDVDAEYWNQVYRMSQGDHDAPDVTQYQDDLLQEEKLPTKDELANVAKVVGSTSNPIQPTSVGKDQDLVVTPNWTDGKELVELSEMKAKLEQLESKLNAAESFGESSKGIQGKIDALKQQIDDLSDSLTNHRFGNEPN